MSGRPEGDFVFACYSCLFVTNNDSLLQEHLEKEHYRDKYFWCKWCGKMFESANELIGHISSNGCNETFNHPCGFEGCAFSDNHPSQFIAHLKNVHKNKYFMPCSYCHRLFSLPPYLVKHLQNECCNRPTSSTASVTPASFNRISVSGQGSSSQTRETDVSSSTSEKKQKFSGKRLVKLALRNHLKKDQFQCSDEASDDPSYIPVKNQRLKNTSSSSTAKRSLPKIQPNSNLKHKSGGPWKAKTAKKSKPADNSNITGHETTKKESFLTWQDWCDKIKETKLEDAMENLLKVDKIQDFFKCMEKSCDFSTDDEMTFMSHNTKEHSGEPLICLYCFCSFQYCEKLIKHMRTLHTQRSYQCSACLFRGVSEKRVSYHQRDFHVGEAVTVIPCEPQQPSTSENFEQGNKHENRNFYGCFVPSCKYETLITEDYRQHYKENHPNATLFCCSYCKYKTPIFEELLIHFRQHDIHDFECMYCFFGSADRKATVLHLHINHTDDKLLLWSRDRITEKGLSVTESSEMPTLVRELSNDLVSSTSCDNGVYNLFNTPVTSSEIEVTHVRSLQTGEKDDGKVELTNPMVIRDVLNVQDQQVHKPDLTYKREMHKRSSIENKGSSTEPPMETDSSAKNINNRKEQKEAIGNNRENRTKDCARNIPDLEILGEEEDCNSNTKKPVKCSFCGKEFTYNSRSFIAHIEKDHANINYLKCSLCGFKAKSYSKVRSHANSMHPNLIFEAINIAFQEKPPEQIEVVSFVCVFCNKDVDGEGVIKHLYNEFNCFKYQCGHCDYRSQSVASVEEHNHSEHRKVKSKVITKMNKVLESWIKDYVEAQKTGFDYPLVPLKLSENGIENQCRMCDLQCSSSDKLKKHVYQHLYYKPYQCQLCEEKFYDLASVENHSACQHRTTKRTMKIVHKPLELLESWVDNVISFKIESIRFLSISLITVLKKEVEIKVTDLNINKEGKKLTTSPKLAKQNSYLLDSCIPSRLQIEQQSLLDLVVEPPLKGNDKVQYMLEKSLEPGLDTRNEHNSFFQGCDNLNDKNMESESNSSFVSLKSDQALNITLGISSVENDENVTELVEKSPPKELAVSASVTSPPAKELGKLLQESNNSSHSSTSSKSSDTMEFPDPMLKPNSVKVTTVVSPTTLSDDITTITKEPVFSLVVSAERKLSISDDESIETSSHSSTSSSNKSQSTWYSNHQNLKVITAVALNPNRTRIFGKSPTQEWISTQKKKKEKKEVVLGRHFRR